MDRCRRQALHTWMRRPPDDAEDRGRNLTNHRRPDVTAEILDRVDIGFPSGNLDNANSERLHGLFGRLAREFETALVVVTHNRALAGRADRVLSLDGGRLVPLAGVESMP